MIQILNPDPWPTRQSTSRLRSWPQALKGVAAVGYHGSCLSSERPLPQRVQEAYKVGFVGRSILSGGCASTCGGRLSICGGTHCGRGCAVPLGLTSRRSTGVDRASPTKTNETIHPELTQTASQESPNGTGGRSNDEVGARDRTDECKDTSAQRSSALPHAHASPAASPSPEALDGVVDRDWDSIDKVGSARVGTGAGKRRCGPDLYAMTPLQEIANALSMLAPTVALVHRSLRCLFCWVTSPYAVHPKIPNPILNP